MAKLTHARRPLPVAQGRASFKQRYELLVEAVSPEAPPTSVVMAYDLEGPLRADDLERALAGFVGRHDAMRMSLHGDVGDTRYQVHRDVPIALGRHDAGGASTRGRVEAAVAGAAARAALPFDRSVAPLARADLWTIDERRHVFTFVADHLVFDGWSGAVMMEEVSGAYRRGDEGPAGSGGLTYARWIDEQWEYLESDASVDDRAYWDAELEGIHTNLGVPWRAHRLPDGPPTFETAAAARRLSESTPARVQARARSERATPFAVHAAALGAAVSSVASVRDVPVTASTMNRVEERSASLVGWCANALVYRLDPSAPGDLVAQTRRKMLLALAHSRYPLIAWRVAHGAAGHQTTVEDAAIYVDYLSDWHPSLELEGVTATEIGIESTMAQSLLALFVSGSAARDVTLVYRKDQLPAPAAEELMDAYLHHLEGLLGTP